jgi:hypothetical protein
MNTFTITNIGINWIDIVFELSLENNKTYTIQNVSPYPLEFKSSDTEPTASEYGLVIVPNASWSITVDPLTNFYIRNQKKDDNKLGIIAVVDSTIITG